MMTQHEGKIEVEEADIPTKKVSRKKSNPGNGRGKVFDILKLETPEEFRASEVVHNYPGSAVLFGQGQASTGIYLIHSGNVRLSVLGHGTEGSTSRIARRGEILGLSTTVSGKPYEATGETRGPARIGFIPRHSFIKLMNQDSNFAFQILQFLCDDLGYEFERVRKLVRPERPNQKSL
jgi:CRP-like cAMP-binding protein